MVLALVIEIFSSCFSENDYEIELKHYVLIKWICFCRCQTVFCSFLEVTGLCIFTMGTLSYTVKINGNVSIAVMNCVGIVPIFWQIWKICRRTEQQRARHQGKSALLFLVCGLVQISGFVIVIILTKVSFYC